MERTSVGDAERLERAGLGPWARGRAKADQSERPLNEFDDELDDEFPLGDGTADTSAQVTCPYCGSVNDVALDPAGGSPHKPPGSDHPH